MKEFLQACSAVSLTPSSDGWLMLFPAGETRGHDGRGPYKLSNPEKVIAASLRKQVDLMIDYEHQKDLMPPGTAVPAAGWFSQLKVDADGAILFKPEWTPPAQAKIADKEYRYVSPTFAHDKAGNVIRIIRAALTNDPNFDMKAVASAQGLNLEEETEDDMDKNLKAIATALGLDDKATGEQIAIAATERFDELTGFKTSTASITSTLGLDANATSAEIVSTAATLKQKAEAGPDLTKYVPLELHTATASALASLQKKTAGDQATSLVEGAIKAGKLPPAQKDWAMATASADPKGFETFLENQPVIATAASTDNSGRTVVAGKIELTASQKAMCAQMGLSQEDYKKTLAAEQDAA